MYFVKFKSILYIIHNNSHTDLNPDNCIIYTMNTLTKVSLVIIKPFT